MTREVVALSIGDLQRNRIVLRSELEDDLPEVAGDRIQLQLVIMNLLKNASDAMVGVSDQPGQLTITTQRDAENYARPVIRDAGTGLPVNDLTKLFDAFHTTKTDGMGIGLSVSKSIIERHHGRLWAERNECPGATFAFLIPAAPRVAVVAPQAGAPCGDALVRS